jgi:glycosyltransferase involved in cell wall biosynthesis
VVIPTYNGARFLANTIASVHAQTVQPSEIIVVDDGSTDDSAAVAERCGVTVVRQANGGIGAARNAGIAAATQPWVAFLDHDDMWVANKLELQWQAAHRFPEAVLIAADCAAVSPSGEVLIPSYASRGVVHYDRLTIDERDGDMVLHRRAFDELAMTGWFLMPSASMARRDVLVQAGAFDVRTRRWEDTGCFLRVLKYGALVFVQRPLIKWVVHESNSHKDGMAMLHGFFALHDLMRRAPEAYPASYRRKMDAERPVQLRELARAALDTDARAAMTHAWESLRLAPSLRALLLLGLAVLPPVLRRGLVAAKRRVRGIKPVGH